MPAGIIASLLILISVAASLLAENVQEKTTLAASPSVTISPNVRVSHNRGPFIEATVAANPTNPKNLVASASELIAEGLVATSFVSLDGGLTWRASPLPEMKEGLARGDFSHSEDTWVTYSTNGTVYLSPLRPRKIGNTAWKTQIVVYRSADNGLTWNGPVLVPGESFDRPSIVSNGEEVYLATHASGRDSAIVPHAIAAEVIALLGSVDGGRSFRPLSYIAPDNTGHNPANLIVLPDESLLLPYYDYPRGGRQPLASGRFYVVHATDKGKVLGLPQFVVSVPRPSVQGSIAVDRTSGSFRGRLYAVWESGDLMFLNFKNATLAETNGKRREVSIAYSVDGGASWSAPTVLSVPTAGPAYYSNVTVNSAGVVGIAWLQHESTERARLCYRIYFSASVDGGRTFTPPQVVSDAVSCPDGAENRAAVFPPDNDRIVEDWPRGGDYIGLTTSADGSFHPVWVDARGETFQVYTTGIEVHK